MFYQNTRSPATACGKLSSCSPPPSRASLLAASPGFTAHVDQPVVPAPAGHGLRLPRRQGRQGGARRRHRHARRQDDPGRAVRRRQGPPLPERKARGAHDRLVLAGPPRQRLVLRRGHGRARRSRARHEHRGLVAGGPRRREAGIYMPAQPVPGRFGRQEFYKGQAEDHFEVVTRRAPVSVPVHVVAPRAADEGVDAARARRRRPQVLRPRDRHGARADRARRRRAAGARLRHALTTAAAPSRPAKRGTTSSTLSRAQKRMSSSRPGGPYVRAVRPA